ncbi:type II toxin-antitoxin system PemK/MazF family toxin [Nesterenkonia sp. MY13]|uniref:Type II toxin-antitoxin system PemK/MazF family toxin n=1 Tax=Nesterenkonia sedimenti TaxID=1463632 RepID=A0A7X8YCN2_9MICC|nr:type II toxin-antitoxin system PemK/MazF family toxin [Nesterenkonia sedimenti]
MWDEQFPGPTGYRPAIILTPNRLVPKLAHITVVEVTSTEGPSSTHIQINCDAGLTGRDRSYANATMIHSLPKGRLRKHRGRLSAAELLQVEQAVCNYLALQV